ncbi:MAG: hypothetical protein IKB00_01035 [Bacteroidaceae bacterium]|nr:hypothetical protein [Bacteroidaceae bacterium]
MKRLFFSVFALALGSFVFMSCDDDEKIDSKSGDNEKYMTVAEQQKAIQTSMEGLADAIEFSEFSQAVEVVSQAVGKKWGFLSLMPVLSDSALMADSIFGAKMSYALQLAMGNFEPFEGMDLDLSPLYMAADVHVIDTVIYGDTIAAILIDNVSYDIDHLFLNVFIENHTVTVKAKIESSESEFDYVNVEKNINARLPIPELIDITLSLDGKVLADVKSEYDSDYVISFTNDTISSDDEESFVIEGSKMSAKASAKFVGYELNGKLDFDEETGFDGSLAAKYGSNELFSANGKIDAVFKDVDFTDSVSMIIWAQNPEKLKSISGSASLGGGQIEIKGSLENPFKDETVAKYMRSLMAGVVLTDEQFEEMVAKFNELFNVGIYFKGYEKPQAVLKVKYNKAQNNANGSKADIDDQEPGIVDEIGGALSKVGGYLVFEVHDEAGKAYEIPAEEYFKGIDINQFKQVIMDKVLKAFGPIIAQMNADEEDGEDLD